MALVLMPIALALEGVEFFSSSHMFLGKPGSELATLGVVTVGAVLAFAMNVAEFQLISRTSSVTMSVCGIFKEVRIKLNLERTQCAAYMPPFMALILSVLYRVLNLATTSLVLSTSQRL